MEVELLYAGGRTDGHDEATVAFRNFANEPKSEKITLSIRTKRSTE